MSDDLIPNLYAPISEICTEFGFDPENVASLTIRPRELVVQSYLLNAEGKKFIDSNTDSAATKTETFRIRTYGEAA